MDILSLDMNFRAQVSEFIPCHRLSISIYVYVIHKNLIIMVTKALTEEPELIMNFKAGNKKR